MCPWISTKNPQIEKKQQEFQAKRGKDINPIVYDAWTFTKDVEIVEGSAEKLEPTYFWPNSDSRKNFFTYGKFCIFHWNPHIGLVWDVTWMPRKIQWRQYVAARSYLQMGARFSSFSSSSSSIPSVRSQQWPDFDSRVMISFVMHFWNVLFCFSVDNLFTDFFLRGKPAETLKNFASVLAGSDR